MSTIHLWDNSWHVPEPIEGQRDSFGRKTIDLNKCSDSKNIKADILRPLSQTTIGKLMVDESSGLLVLPNSFNEVFDELKDQFVLSIENDAKTIKSITTGNVVGFIGLGINAKGRSKVDICIHSRFSSNKEDAKGNDYFLYYMLEKVMGVHVNMQNLQTSADTKDAVLDLLYLFFPRMLKEALSQGMYKKYVYHEYNDANIRGVVDVNRHIRLNIPTNGKIAYRTREFSYDNPMTQLIRHTIEFISRKPLANAILHSDADTEGCLRQIIQATPTYQARQRQSIINENLRPMVHPYYTKYTALQKLCLRILRHEKLSYSAASNNRIHGLLIDVAWLWEEYVAKVLAEGNCGLQHYTRKNSPYHLFEDKIGRFQKIIPDYYDKEKNLVADAKYIPLHRCRNLSADRAAPIYYKTIMYMYRFNAQKGFLFHPCTKSDVEEMEMANEDVIEKYSDGNIVVTTYNIEGRKDSLLRKVGLVIPTKEQEEQNENATKTDNEGKAKTEDPNIEEIVAYTDFRARMCKIEESFSDTMGLFL